MCLRLLANKPIDSSLILQVAWELHDEPELAHAQRRSDLSDDPVVSSDFDPVANLERRHPAQLSAATTSSRRRSSSYRPPDRAHPLGYGREAYVWSLLAALGLFVAGAAVSVTHGVQELIRPEPATDFVVGYVVLALSFVLEGISFLRSVRQARPTAELLGRDVIEEVMATSDPTLRAIFFEDSAALVGLVIAAVGLAAHQATGSSTPDAVGSILVGVLLAVVAVVLINRNRQFLVGEEADPRIRAAAIRALLEMPEVARVTYLRLEIVGPRMVYVIGDVDLVGDDPESHVAVRLRRSSRGSAPPPRWRAPC